MAGCDYVIHVASPLPLTPPKTDEEVIVPARDGGTRAEGQHAVRRGQARRPHLDVWRRVLGHPRQAHPFDETSWTDIESCGRTGH